MGRYRRRNLAYDDSHFLVGQAGAMRELDDEERRLLVLLDEGVSTDDLIEMVRDLGAILRARGHGVQANVAELAADRLVALSLNASGALQAHQS